MEDNDLHLDFDVDNDFNDEGYFPCLEDELSAEWHLIETSLVLYEGHDVHHIREEINWMIHNPILRFPRYIFAAENANGLKFRIHHLYNYSLEFRGYPLIQLKELAIVLLSEANVMNNEYERMYEEDLWTVTSRRWSYFEELSFLSLLGLISSSSAMDRRYEIAFFVVTSTMNRIVIDYESRYMELCHIDPEFYLAEYVCEFESTGANDDEGIA